MGNKQEDHLEQLKNLTDRFCMCLCFQNMEEDESNDEEVMNAWMLILRKLLKRIKNVLTLLKEEIAWSLLDDKTDKIFEITKDLKPMLEDFKYYEEDEEGRKIINDTIFLINDGINGFRQSFFSETYYEDLFNRELKKYRNENLTRIELIYKQDCQDQIRKYTDENQLRNAMLDISRQQLFDSRFGIIFHNQGREIKQLTFYIIEQKEQDYKDINDFFDKYIAYEIAKEYCQKKQEAIYKNIIFKDNVDVDKVMRKLNDFIADKTLSKQIHWYIVYKVFATKKWLKSDKQTDFVEQMNSAFYSIRKCSKTDFHEVKSYFKEKAYSDWTIEDINAPQCCNKYKLIADTLDTEFEDSKYAKPGTMINTRKIEKFR